MSCKYTLSTMISYEAPKNDVHVRSCLLLSLAQGQMYGATYESGTNY